MLVPLGLSRQSLEGVFSEVRTIRYRRSSPKVEIVSKPGSFRGYASPGQRACCWYTTIRHTRRGGVGSLPSDSQGEGKMGMSGVRNHGIFWARRNLAAAVVAAVFVFVAMLAMASPALADNFKVTTDGDTPVADAAVCDSNCSLREAVKLANSNAGRHRNVRYTWHGAAHHHVDRGPDLLRVNA